LTEYNARISAFRKRSFQQLNFHYVLCLFAKDMSACDIEVIVGEMCGDEISSVLVSLFPGAVIEQVID